MPNQISIEAIDFKDYEVILMLLKSEKLPIEDLTGEIKNFFVAKDDGFVIGGIGLEIYGSEGLLRSLVVNKKYRHMKIASRLIDKLESFGRLSGLKSIYLLTETAEGYFTKNGYLGLCRTEAPESIIKSSEFSHICPSTAVLMKKTL